MKKNDFETLNKILDGLMARYKQRVPDVAAVVNIMIKENLITNDAEIENDHIAFRTTGVKHLGIGSLEKIFLHFGYQRRDHYVFPEKKLDAYWYAPPEEKFPRIFISELRVNELSEKAQNIIHSYTNEVTTDPVKAIDLDNPNTVDNFLHSALWRLPSLEDYLELAKESEYAAWVIYNRYYLNHFTISVHNLKEGYNTIPLFNSFLERNNLKLNDAGGKMKTSADGALSQSSTIAEMMEANFADEKKHAIAGSYVEFAERKILQEFSDISSDKIQRKHRREGFEANNADKIFESTYSSQTDKK